MPLVNDSFVEASDTLLSSHVPDTGNQWVAVATSSTQHLQVVAATDRLSADANSSNNGEFCKSQPSPTSADYDVQITIVTVDAAGTTPRTWRIHGRMPDANNGYYVEWYPTTDVSDNDTNIYKIVGGTRTQLATVDTGLVDGDIFRFEINDLAKTLYKNGTSILTSSDNTITAAGEAGISAGAYNANVVGNINNSWKFDDFSVTEFGASGPDDMPRILSAIYRQ